MLAESPRYRALYDPTSGVTFSRGRAEVTEEQALALAKRRFADGILIDGIPAKHWARDRARQDNNATGTPPQNSGETESAEGAAETPADPGTAKTPRKAR